MISGKAKKIKCVFEKALRNNSYIEGLILASDEGLVMLSAFQESSVKESEEETIAAMAAGIDSLIPHFLQNIHWNSFSDILIKGSNEYILIKNIKEIGFLIILIRSEIPPAKLFDSICRLLFISYSKLEEARHFKHNKFFIKLTTLLDKLIASLYLKKIKFYRKSDVNWKKVYRDVNNVVSAIDS